MANKNFEIKNGLTVAGTERITSAGVITGTTATQSASDNTTKLASTAYVTTALANLSDSAPSTLNTLNELAAALGDDANYATTTTNAIAAKLPLAGGTLTGNISLGDNNKAIFGAGSDLQIYHDGTHSHIRNTTGNLYLQDDGYIEIGSPSGEVYIGAVKDGAVNLRYDNNIKIATTSTGIDVTGTTTTNNLTIDDGVIEFDKPSVFGFRFLQNDAGNDLSIQQGDANNANYVTRLNINSSGNVGIGTSGPLGKLHVRDGSAQAGISHTYIYDGSAISIEATEPGIQLMAEDSGTHGGSLLWRYGNNAFAAIANPTTDAIDFTYGVTTNNDFQVHSGTNMSSYLKIMSIGANGNVGIGETSPLGKLHVKSADSGAGADAGADELVVEGSGDSGLSILSGASNYGTILFSDSGDAAAGRIRYEHNNNALNFGTNGSWDRLYINSSGNVGIGIAPMTALHVQSNGAPDTSGNMTSGIVVSDSVGGPAIKLSCHNSAGYNYIQSSYVNNANVGRDLAIWRGALEKARVTSTGLQVTSEGGTRLKVENTDTNWAALDITSGGNQANYVFFNDNSAERARMTVYDSNDMSFSTGSSPSEKMRILAGGGITFNGDSSAANALDDYEEGTFTPVVENGTYTYSFRRGHYTKIGNIVHIHIGFKLNAASPGTSVGNISGLPFTSMNYGSYREPHGRIGAGGLFVTANLGSHLTFYKGNSNTQLYARTTSTNGDSPANSNTIWQAGTFIKLQMSYTVS